MIQIMRDVSEVGLPSTNLSSHLDRLFERKMRGMRLSAESVEDQDVQALKSFQALRRNLIGVRAVGDISKAKAERPGNQVSFTIPPSLEIRARVSSSRSY